MRDRLCAAAAVEAGNRVPLRFRILSLPILAGRVLTACWGVSGLPTRRAAEGLRWGPLCCSAKAACEQQCSPLGPSNTPAAKRAARRRARARTHARQHTGPDRNRPWNGPRAGRPAGRPSAPPSRARRPERPTREPRLGVGEAFEETAVRGLSEGPGWGLDIKRPPHTHSTHSPLPTHTVTHPTP